MTLIQKRTDAYPEGYVPHPHESLLVENAEVVCGIPNPFIYPFWKDASLLRMTIKRPRMSSSWIRPRQGASGRDRIRWERDSGWGAAFPRLSVLRGIQPIFS